MTIQENISASCPPPAAPARRWKRHRRLTRLQAFISLSLAALVLILVNLVAQRLAWRHDFSRTGHGRLSENTLQLLDGLRQNVNITVLMQPTHELAEEVNNLLREYSFASPRVNVTTIDPHRDLTLVSELAERHGLRESNLAIFESGGRQSNVDIETIAEFDYLPVLYGQPRRLKAFRGEAAFSAAIHRVSDLRTPVVYALQGYSQRDLNDPHPVSGYSALAKLIREEHMVLRTLSMAAAGGIPDDADLLLLAGPRRPLAAAELDILSRYLENQGRLLLLMDPAETGLENLLERWGITVGTGTVTGLTLSGAELFVGAYGEHPVTRNLAGVTTVFYRPRPLYANERAAPAATDQADRLRVSILAAGRSVAYNTSSPASEPPAVNGAPPGIVAAVEKGSALSADARMRPTRLIVFSDADCMSNQGMRAGNAALLVNALNWLVERDHRLNIAPRLPETDTLILHRQSLNLILLTVLAACPLAWLALGLAVCWRRGAAG